MVLECKHQYPCSTCTTRYLLDNFTGQRSHSNQNLKDEQVVLVRDIAEYDDGSCKYSEWWHKMHTEHSSIGQSPIESISVS